MQYDLLHFLTIIIKCIIHCVCTCLNLMDKPYLFFVKYLIQKL